MQKKKTEEKQQHYILFFLHHHHIDIKCRALCHIYSFTAQIYIYITQKKKRLIIITIKKYKFN